MAEMAPKRWIPSVSWYQIYTLSDSIEQLDLRPEKITLLSPSIKRVYRLYGHRLFGTPQFDAFVLFDAAITMGDEFNEIEARDTMSKMIALEETLCAIAYESSPYNRSAIDQAAAEAIWLNWPTGGMPASGLIDHRLLNQLSKNLLYNFMYQIYRIAIQRFVEEPYDTIENINEEGGAVGVKMRQLMAASRCAPSPEVIILRREELHDAIALLPQNVQLPAHMVLQGYPLPEIADRINISVAELEKMLEEALHISFKPNETQQSAVHRLLQSLTVKQEILVEKNLALRDILSIAVTLPLRTQLYLLAYWGYVRDMAQEPISIWTQRRSLLKEVVSNTVNDFYRQILMGNYTVPKNITDKQIIAMIAQAKEHVPFRYRSTGALVPEDSMVLRLLEKGEYTLRLMMAQQGRFTRTERRVLEVFLDFLNHRQAVLTLREIAVLLNVDYHTVERVLFILAQDDLTNPRYATPTHVLTPKGDMLRYYIIDWYHQWANNHNLIRALYSNLSPQHQTLLFDLITYDQAGFYRDLNAIFSEKYLSSQIGSMKTLYRNRGKMMSEIWRTMQRIQP